MNTCKIYSLIDPRTGAIRYVGRTVQPLDFRLANHIRDAKVGKKCLRAAWVRELLNEGLRPLIRTLEIVPNEIARTKERQWTLELMGNGCDLVNSNVAGGGSVHPKTYVDWTPDIDQKLGMVADSVIAESIGVTRKAVSYRRKKLGIPASFDRTRNTPPPPMAGHNRIQLPDAIIERLGKEPDYILGDKIGVAKTVIAKARKARGIPPYAESTGNTGQYKKGNFPARWLKGSSNE